jgi:hypothetical protein
MQGRARTSMTSPLDLSLEPSSPLPPLTGLALLAARRMPYLYHRDAVKVNRSGATLWAFPDVHRRSDFSLGLGFQIKSAIVYGWLPGSAVVAALIPALDPDRRGPPFWSIAALILLPITLIAGCEAGTGVLPD